MSMYKVSPAVKPRSQSLGTSCWLSCLEMLYIWKNDKGDRTKNIDEILSKMDESPDLYPYYMQTTTGMFPSQYRPTARMLGLGCSGDTETIDAKLLKTMLQKHGPLMIGGKFSKGHSHAIVVTGCDPETGNIRYVDPWNNYTLEESPQTVKWLEDRGSSWTNCDASILYWR